MEGHGNRRRPMRMRGRMWQVSLAATVLIAITTGCGTKEDTTLNQVRHELKAGNLQRAEHILSQTRRYPDDLVDTAKRSLRLSEANWKAETLTKTGS